MPQILGLDPNSILRILTNTDDPNRRFPGPQTADQISKRGDYAYDLMKNMQLQGNANYVPMNALADSIRGYMGGRYLEKNERATRNIGERQAKAWTRGLEPTWGGSTQPTLTEPIAAEGNTPSGPTVKPSRQQEAGGVNVDALVKEAADKAGVDPTWLRTFVDIESGGNPRAKKGQYMGLLQVSPEEAAQYGQAGVDVMDPATNLAIGAAKLKAEKERFEQKYGHQPTVDEMYMTHQQGEGGYAAHVGAPDAPAWENMAKTREGQRMGAKWAKKAIWNNLTPEAQKEFKDVNNITSGQFMDFWRNKVNQGLTKYNQTGLPQPLTTGSITPQKPLPPGRAQGMGFDNEAAKSMIGEEVPTDLSFNRNAIGAPGNEVLGTNILAQSPEKIASEVATAGGVSNVPKNVLPQPPQNQTIVPKTSIGVPAPPEGTQRIEAQIPNTQDQFAGMSQTREPEMQMAADTGGQNTGEELDLPVNPYSQMHPNQLYEILKDPATPPEMKQFFMNKFQEQGQMQAIPVEGGKLYYNPRTKKQLYVPEPKWGQTSIGGISVPTISIKRKANGPWESFLMDGSPVPGSGGENKGGGGGSPTSDVIPTQSGGGQPASQTNQQSGGLEALHQRGVNMERRKQLTEKQTGLQSEERSQHAKVGELAEKNIVALQRLRQLENAPNINDITTGMTAPAWNELKKTLNTWLPGTIAKEGPISLHDIYSSIATNAAATLARASDPNPSVKQFEAMLSTNPGFAQTPAGRKALLLSLEHTVNLDRDIGKIAKSSESMTDPDEYNRKVQAVRDRYAQKKIIPDIFLDPKFIKSREFKNMKWLSEGENPDDKVKKGEYFVTPDGKIKRRIE